MIRLPGKTRVALLLAVTILVGGCATLSTPSSSLFVLNDGPQPASGVPNPALPTVMIAPVNVADYLTQGGIVYQTAPYRVVIANNNRWASPLAGQLTDTLYDVLSRRLQQVNVQRATGDQAGLYQLQTRIDRFYGSYDGSAHIDGQWQLVSPGGKIVRSKSFTRTIALKHNGYPALVASLSSGWQAVAADIATPLATAIEDDDRSAADDNQ